MSRVCTNSTSSNSEFGEHVKSDLGINIPDNVENDISCFESEKQTINEVCLKKSDSNCKEDGLETDIHKTCPIPCSSEADNVFYSDVTSGNVDCCDARPSPDRAESTDQTTDKSVSVAATEVPAESERDRALLARKQPLMELVYSEEGYVRRLRMVKEHYIPLVPIQHRVQTSDSLISTASNTGSLRENTPAQQALHPPPTVPDDLAARWRIMWGNWLQLYEWHSNFYERLSTLVENEPDQIPKQFIDARARLRNIYSKYCENHRKAALIAEQYRDYFEELRGHLGDKEDVVSYLMQPVQRIMRYQLPIAEILKYTRRADLPELATWQKALDIMKEIPKDTQLILEAARIDGFPGVITALGNILIRGDLLVATTSHEQLLDLVTAYKLTLQELHSTSAMNSNTGASTSHTPCVASAESPSDSHTNSIAGTQLSPQSTASIPTTPSDVAPPESESVATSSPAASSVGLFTGNLKFVESRVFLFDQMLLVTEEVKSKRRMASSDTFAQSTYQFRAAINVNKMRYESHWYNFSLSNGHTNADAAAVDYLLSTGTAPDDLRFAVLDQTPNRTVAYIMDPVTSTNREAWVVQLRDIQRMQTEFLRALQDPRRFNTGSRGDANEIPWMADSRPNTGRQAHAEAGQLITPPPLHPSTGQSSGASQPHTQQRQRKWPSLTMKRPGRLSSSSSGGGSSTTHQHTQSFPEPKPDDKQGQQSPQQRADGRFQRIKQPSGSRNQKQWNKGITRSRSAERQPIGEAGSNITIIDSTKNQSSTTNDRPDRKCSLSAEASFKTTNVVFDTDSPASEVPKGGGVGKRLNVLSSLFGRNKSKHRTKTHQPQTQATSSTLNPVQSSSGRIHVSQTSLPVCHTEPGTSPVETPSSALTEDAPAIDA